jgi:hypothetical protein
MLSAAGCKMTTEGGICGTTVTVSVAVADTPWLLVTDSAST